MEQLQQLMARLSQAQPAAPSPQPPPPNPHHTSAPVLASRLHPQQQQQPPHPPMQASPPRPPPSPSADPAHSSLFAHQQQQSADPLPSPRQPTPKRSRPSLDLPAGSPLQVRILDAFFVGFGFCPSPSLAVSPSPGLSSEWSLDRRWHRCGSLMMNEKLAGEPQPCTATQRPNNTPSNSTDDALWGVSQPQQPTVGGGGVIHSATQQGFRPSLDLQAPLPTVSGVERFLFGGDHSAAQPGFRPSLDAGPQPVQLRQGAWSPFVRRS
jgi:hypothetical protein